MSYIKNFGFILAFILSAMFASPAAVASLVKNPSIENLNPQVLKLALTAYSNAKLQDPNIKELLTVVDYSLPSTQKRFWVIDMKTFEIIHHTYVAHGNATGGNFAKNFSNINGSNMSSIGIFKTGNTYYGRNGLSLNLHGLEKQFNGNAYSRRIVVHGAPYVSTSYIKRLGRLGRSQGCFALTKQESSEIINLLKGGSIIFSYYPDEKWLENSVFLKKPEPTPYQQNFPIHA